MSTVQQCRHEAKITFYEKNVHVQSSLHMRKSQQFTTGFFPKSNRKLVELFKMFGISSVLCMMEPFSNKCSFKKKLKICEIIHNFISSNSIYLLFFKNKFSFFLNWNSNLKFTFFFNFCSKSISSLKYSIYGFY